MKRVFFNTVNTFFLFPKKTGLLGLLIGCMVVLGTSAYAQSTCTSIPQRVLNNQTMATSLTGWNSTGGWARISLFGSPPGAQLWSNNTSGASLSQALTQVSGGAIVQFNLAWNNAERTDAGSPQWVDGNQIRMEISYGGVVYATIYTSPWAGGTNTTRPGPSNSSIVMSNGATLLSGNTSPAPTNLSTGFTWNAIKIQLPNSVAQTGTLQFSASQNQNVSSPLGADDDFYLQDIQVLPRTLCIIKSTPTGPGGTFGFMTTNLDTNLVTVGNQNNPSITTSGTTAVAIDTNTGTTGSQPALVMSNPVTLSETTLPANYGMYDVSCDQGVTTTVNTTNNSATLGSLPAGTQTNCTVVNRQKVQLRVQKRWGARSIAGDIATVSTSGFKTGGISVTSTAPSPMLTSTSDTDSTTTQTVYAGETGGQISETFGAQGNINNYTQTYQCTGASSANSTGAITVASGDTGTTITCRIINTRKSQQLTLSKNWVDGISGHISSATTTGTTVNQASFTSTSNGGVTQTGAPGATVIAYAGETFTLPTESFGGGATSAMYGTAVACSGGTTLNSTTPPATLTISNTSTAATTCTYTNTRKIVDLAIAKVSDPTGTLVSGSPVEYTITVTNAGSIAVPAGATVQDSVVSGLNCPSTNTVICTGAGCPSSPSPITFDNLSSGLTLGSIPVAPNNIVTLKFTCTVN